MTRHDVDYDAVKQAAITLLSEGMAPSIHKVSDMLETGSHTTIDQVERLKHQLAEQQQAHQSQLNQERLLQENSETRWLHLIDEACENERPQRKQDEKKVKQQQQKFDQLQHILIETQKQVAQQHSLLTERQQQIETPTQQGQRQQNQYLDAITTIANLEIQLTTKSNKNNKPSATHGNQSKSTRESTHV